MSQETRTAVAFRLLQSAWRSVARPFKGTRVPWANVATISRRFDFFLSHNSADKPIIEQIAEQLLEEAGLTCWIDIWSIPAASDWEAEIRHAIQSCRGTLIFFGPSGWGRWHAREALLALEHAKSHPGYLIIPVMLSDYRGSVPSPGEDNDRSLETFFEVRQWVRHGTNDSELVDQVRSAMGDTPPHPLGRARLTPYVVRRDARRWASPTGGKRRRHPSRLYRGSQLQEALSVANQYPGQLDAPAFEFLRSSQQRQKTVAWRWVLGVAGIAAVLLTLALREARERSIATSRLFAVLSADEHAKGNLTAAALLAVESWRSWDTVAARQQLFRLAERYAHLRAVLREKPADDLVESWVAINPAGTQLAVSTGSELNLWDLQKPSLPPTNLLLRSGLGPVAYSVDGRLAVATDIGIMVWLRPGQKKEPDFQTEAASPEGHTFTRTGELWWLNQSGHLVSTNPDGRVGRSLPASQVPLTRVVGSRDLQRIVTGDQKGGVKLWKVAEEIGLEAQFQTTDQVPIDLMALSPDSRWLIAGKARGKVELFDVQSGTVAALGNEITAAGFINDNRFALGYANGSVRIFHAASPLESPFLDLRGHGTRICALCADGDVGVSTDDAGTVLLWQFRENALVPREFRVGDRSVVDLNWSSNGKRIATATKREGFRVIDVTTGAVSPLQADSEANVVRIDATGSRILTGSDDGQLSLWGLTAGIWDRLANVKQSEGVTALARNSSTAASGTAKGTLALWRIGDRTIEPLSTVNAHHYAIKQLSFDRCGSRIASGSLDGAAKIWYPRALRSGGPKPLARIDRGRGQTHFVVLHPSGKTLLVGGAIPTLEYRRVDSPEVFGEMTHTSGLTALAMDATGDYAMTADMDGCISIWHVQSAQPILSKIKPDAEPIESLAFSSASSLVAAGTFDGRVLLIDLDPNAAVRHLLRLANRNFSPREWNQFMGGKRYRATSPELPQGIDRHRSYD